MKRLPEVQLELEYGRPFQAEAVVRHTISITILRPDNIGSIEMHDASAVFFRDFSDRLTTSDTTSS